MNPFQLLEEDHKTVAALLKKLDETTERGMKTRQDLFAKLKTDLEVHTHIEETIFYPALMEEKETEDVTREAFEEHKVVKTLLAELDSMSKEDEQWGAKLTVLKENIEHHVEEEEGEMFRRARAILSKSEIDGLGTRMADAKEKFLTKA